MLQSQECLELTQRMLWCVTSVWKVKTLQWQLVTTNKKRKLGDGLFTEEPDAEEPCVQTVGSYLDSCSRSIAYALAGSGSVAGAPDHLGADPARFVEAPLDIMFCYHAPRGWCPHRQGTRSWRGCRRTTRRREQSGRGYREPTRTLGQIMKEIYEARDTHMGVSSQHGNAAPSSRGGSWYPEG